MLVVENLLDLKIPSNSTVPLKKATHKSNLPGLVANMSLPSELKDLDPRTLSKGDLGTKFSYDEAQDKWTFTDPSTKDKYEFSPVLERWLSLEFVSPDTTEAQQELLEKKRQRLMELKAEKLKKHLLLQKQQRQNTSIYVSNLPIDIDLAELKQVFTKYGVIAEDLLTSKPKIKLYQDQNGNFKGDALISYLKPESVELAIQMLDDTKLRSSGTSIKVQRAEFKEKAPTESADGTSTKRALTEEDKKVIKKKMKSLNDKIEDWNGDDDSVNPKWLRTVVLKRVFTLKELDEDPYAKKEIIEDIEEGCGQIGAIEKVILFDLEEEGVVLVRFETGDAAVRCIEKMDGRYFAGQKLIAMRYTGEHFNKTENITKRKDIHSGHDNDESARLESFITQNS